MQGKSCAQGVAAFALHLAPPETEGRTRDEYWRCRNFDVSPQADPAVAFVTPT